MLLPTRLSLPSLEAELRSIQVPYRAENASVVYATAEVRDVLMAVRAADDPTDELAVVAALRSALYGCSDVELYDWRRRGGNWSLLRPAPDDLAEHPVAAGLAHLRTIHDRIPYVGAAVVTIPIAFVAFFQFGWGWDFGKVVIAYGIIQALDGNVLVPLLFSEALNLHPVAIIVAILVFGGLWGFWGVFFAIPLATLVNAVLRAWPRRSPVASPA